MDWVAPTLQPENNFQRSLRGRSGVYTIWIKGRAYVGSAVDLGKRLRRHVKDLSRGEHDNEFFQRAYDKYGAETIRLGVIEFCDGYTEQELRYLEFIQMDRLKEVGVELFNMALDPSTGGCSGYKHTEDAKRKISEAKKGNWKDLEYRMRQSEATRGNQSFLGHKHSDEMKRKMSEAMKGDKHPFFGKKHSEESRRKMCRAQRLRRASGRV